MNASALPPGPRAPRAVQMADVAGPAAVVRQQCRARFGDMFTVRIEERPWVMLGRPRATCARSSPRRADLIHAGDANAILRPMLGPSSVLLLDGAEHMHQRKLMLPASTASGCAATARSCARRPSADRRRWPVGEPFALRPHTQAITLEVIVRAVFGVDDPRARTSACARCSPRVLDRLTARAADGTDRRRSAPTPADPGAFAARAAAPSTELLSRSIAERRAAPDLAERDDVLSMLLLARDEEGGALSDAELRDELMTLLVAGHETTANSLAWAFERLARTPAALDARRADDAAYAEAGSARRCACARSSRSSPAG